jgi:peptide/nickel transport system permease protein
VFGYLFRRLIQAVVVILGVVFITLMMYHMLPFDPARAILPPRSSPSTIQAFEAQNGFNQNILWQYYHQVWNLLHFNLGRSYKLNQTVSQLIVERLPRTLVLVGISTLVAVIIAIPLGVLQVLRRNTAADYVLTGGSFIFYAMPTFFLGYILIDLFAVEWHIFPTSVSATSIGELLADPKQLVLPVFTLAAVTIAGFSRYMRSSMMEQLAEDYVRTAKAKGLGRRRVIYLHALRNALIPIITLLGLALPGIVSGAVITEQIFNYPGMGLLFYNQGAEQLDYPVLIGCTLVATVATVVGSLLADVLYASLDPRIRYAG